MKHARPRLHDRLGSCLILTLFALGVAVLAGCTMTADNVTGLGFVEGGPTSCVKDCNDRFKKLYQDEQKLHSQNVEYCQSLSQPDKGDCLVAEDARHQAAMDALGAGKIECQNSCHRQGAGTAG